MKWSRNLHLSWTALRDSPGRAVLSVLAVAVGIAAVTLLVALEAGADRALQATLEHLGRHLLVVNAGRTETGALRGASRPVETLTLDDWRAIAEQVPALELAAPAVSRDRTLRAGRRVLRATVTGSTPELGTIRNLDLSAGRFFDADDVAERRRVVVVGAHVVRELWFGELPLGEVLRIGGVPFTVVGVLAARGVSLDGTNEDNLVLVPISAARSRLFGVEHLDRVFVQARSKPAMAEAEEGVRSLLAERHGGEDFEIRDQEALLAAQADTGSTLRRLVGAVAALTLGLGGAGLLAVSLLAVRERRSEIGLRLAVGARRRDILGQFLAEALLLAVLGGVLGLGLGGAGVALGESLSGWNLAWSWRAVGVALAFSLGVAALFGTWPALRAARLDPIVALRDS